VVAFAGIERAIRPWKDFYDGRRLATYLAQERFEIVHTHTSKGGMIGRYAASRAKVPAAFHTVHGFSAHEFSSLPARMVVAALERRAAHWCDLVLVMNSYDEAWARGFCKPEKFVYVPNGIPPERLAASQGASRDMLLSEVGIPASAHVIGNICRLCVAKNLSQFVETIAHLPHVAGRPVFGLLVGDGESMASLRALVEQLGITQRMIFLGFRDDAVRWLAAMDLFLSTSRREGMSISLLEAMGAGRAIVGTKIRGNVDCLQNGKNGILVPFGDAAATAKACQTLLEAPEYAHSLGRQAYESFLVNHTEDVFIKRVWERAYLPVLREKGLNP
jgi:glycosyltransferase involved in cell wall biosynthesis